MTIKNIDSLTTALRTQLGDKKIEAQDAGAGAHVARAIATTIARNTDQIAKADRQNPYSAARQLADALFKSGAIADLADTAVVQEAAQRLARSEAIHAEFDAQLEARFGKATSIGTPSEGAIAKLGSSLSGPVGNIGATLAARMSHQTWVAAGSTWAVNLEAHPEAAKQGLQGEAKLRRDQLNTQYDVAGRTTFEDFNVLQEDARAASNDAGKTTFRIAVEDARRGTNASLQAVAHYFQTGAIPTPGNARLAAQVLADPLANAGTGSILLDPESRGTLANIGHELTVALRAFEAAPPQSADEAKAFWEQHPVARDLAATEQMFWLAYDLDKSEGQKTGKSAKKFIELTPENQIQNVRSTLTGLLGVLDADDLLRGVLFGKQQLTPELGEILQAHLDQASQQAILTANAQGDYALASAISAKAVSEQQLIQIVVFAREAFGKSFTEAEANDLFQVLYRSAKESSDKYGQGGPDGGASGASKIGVKYIGELLGALFPGQKKDWAKHGTELLGASSFDTEVALMHKMGIPYDGDGESLKRAIGEAYKDNWGIDDILKIPAKGRKFNDDELFAFYGMMTLLNNTWGSQQPSRSIEETVAGKDDSRVNADKRGGVWRSYLYMLKGLNDPKETGLRIAQDHMEAGKKAGTLPEKNDLA